MSTARQVAGGALVCLAVVIGAQACSSPEQQRARQTTIPTYDTTTGKLTQLTFDRDHDGVVDTWTEMDGATPLRSRIDLNEDGKIDRWEYYDRQGQLLKVGFSRKNDGRPDAWAYANADGRVVRVEVSSTSDERHIDRWEHYEASRAAANGDPTGSLVRAEEDTNRDGRPDTWETYSNGALATVAMDQDGDGRPDRRLTYAGATLVKIETDPDASGAFRKAVELQ